MCERTQEPFHYASGLCTPLILPSDEEHGHQLKEFNCCQTSSDNLCKYYIFNLQQMLFYFRLHHQ